MDQRVAYITGAASGLGLTCARQFAADGMALHLIDRDEGALHALTQSLGAASVTSSTTDIRTQAACRQAVSAGIRAHGTVDVLVNCAGVYPRAPILEITEDQWRLDFDVNVLGTYFMAIEAVRHMQPKGRGHIVNVSSIDAFVAHPANAHYAATKAAVVSLTRSLALALAPDGIMVNSVAPGPMATDQARATDWYEEMVGGLPTGKPIEPSEVARLVAYLCRVDNVSITGENIIISGGLTIA
jgi:NAD(P)-dependent dehydrogenase (short-subunit alcohol dehydrogenase family)